MKRAVLVTLALCAAGCIRGPANERPAASSEWCVETCKAAGAARATFALREHTRQYPDWECACAFDLAPEQR